MISENGSSTPNSPGSPRWTLIIAAGGAAVAGLLAAYSPAWAVGVSTAAALYTTIREHLQR